MADVLIHELLHDAWYMYGSTAVRSGWEQYDGGDDPASVAYQSENQMIVSRCFH